MEIHSITFSEGELYQKMVGEVKDYLGSRGDHLKTISALVPTWRITTAIEIYGIDGYHVGLIQYPGLGTDDRTLWTLIIGIPGYQDSNGLYKELTKRIGKHEIQLESQEVITAKMMVDFVSQDYPVPQKDIERALHGRSNNRGSGVK